MILDTHFWIYIGAVAVILVLLLVVLFLQIKIVKQNNNDAKLSDISTLIQGLGSTLSENQKQANQMLGERLNHFSEQTGRYQEFTSAQLFNQLETMQTQLHNQSLQNVNQLENIRTTLQNRITALQDSNTHQLEKMQGIVDEKLQKTLEDKLSRSFSQVSERLEQVYKGLGEMQNLATGVGDLKKVLSNVKTRGILGEIQLGAILEELLSPEQYAQNIATKPGSPNFVEFAVKLPGEDNPVYLPIDAKFPMDAYSALCDAYDSGEQQQIELAGSVLETRIKRFAKDIHDKYVAPPYTTDFGILFLPTEGLYAEVVRRGMVETLQRDYKINIAGPTTMAALLNSLQMGFKTLAIQKRSSEVWQVLSAVKEEFDTFADVLSSTQHRLEQAGADLDKLIGVRTRQIQRKLKDVSALETIETIKIPR